MKAPSCRVEKLDVWRTKTSRSSLRSGFLDEGVASFLRPPGTAILEDPAVFER